MTEKDQSKAGLDRRALIKRAGIVTAGVAAWSTPMVTTMASKAYAAGSPTVTCNNCQVGQTPCYEVRSCGDGAADCRCFQSHDGSACGCVDALDGSCASFAVCGPGGSCPAGYSCMATCCADLLCFPDCGSGNKAPKTGARGGAGRVSKG